jgi:hypothetical protein
MMKKILLSLFILLNVSLYGVSLDRYISAMQHASPQKRVKMMNKLKVSLAKMNSSDRQRAIRKLRSRTHTRATRMRSNAATQLMTQVATSDRMNQSININNIPVINTTSVQNVVTQGTDIINQPPTYDDNTLHKF